MVSRLSFNMLDRILETVRLQTHLVIAMSNALSSASSSRPRIAGHTISSYLSLFLCTIDVGRQVCRAVLHQLTGHVRLDTPKTLVGVPRLQI